jgi:hypothetical protein
MKKWFIYDLTSSFQIWDRFVEELSLWQPLYFPDYSRDNKAIPQSGRCIAPIRSLHQITVVSPLHAALPNVFKNYTVFVPQITGHTGIVVPV